MNTMLVQELPSAPTLGVEAKLEPPQALTPEVMVFMATLCFLAVCGLIRR